MCHWCEKVDENGFLNSNFNDKCRAQLDGPDGCVRGQVMGIGERGTNILCCY